MKSQVQYMKWKRDFQSFKKGKPFVNISSHKQPSENDLVISGEVGEGGRGASVPARPLQVLGIMVVRRNQLFA